MLLSIIIINYNTPIYTIDAIRSVFREAESEDFEVILFDNGSTDDSVSRLLKSEFINKISFIRSKKNIGFAAGNNSAAKQAKGKYLLLLNPDTIVQNHAIDRLLTFAREYPNAGIWGGRTMFADKSLNPGSCWQRQTLWSLLIQATGLSSLFRSSSLFNPEGIGGWDRIGIRDVDIVSGCFFLIRYSLWKKLDGFDPDFFMYGEEADLCIRAKKIGAQPMVNSDATIIHYGGASEKIRSDAMVKLLRAKTLLIQKHFNFTLRRVGSLLLACWPLSRYIAHCLLSRTGYKTSLESARVWGDVWKRKNEWLGE